MKLFSLLAVVVAFGLGSAPFDAEAARRLGGGKSSGMQKQMTPDKTPAAAPAPAPAGAAAPAQAAKAPARSWLGPVAGLAAGLGLAALASHFGFGEELASMMMMALLAFAVLAVIGFIMRRKAGSGPALAGVGGPALNPAHHHAPMQRQANAIEPTVGASAASAAGPVSATPTRAMPADFDAAGFERAAKVNFIRLQAANDVGNIDDIRQFTTPEMFGELSLAIAERGTASQHTDVLNIDAKVLEVAEDDNRYVASVRFTGLIREDAAANPEAVDEVWHLIKARNGAGGWLLAGIQQLA